MKVLLTGGTGYVGQSLKEKLRAQGHEVRLMVRQDSAHKIGSGDGYEVIEGDVLDSHACLKAVDGCAAVVNLVGIIREYPDAGTTYVALHTEATYNVLDAARRSGVDRFIQMSALGARPDSRSKYHTTKYEAEEIVRKSDLRWTVFRPSVIFGRGDMFVRELVDLVHRQVVPLIDGGKASLQPVSLDNVTDAMANSLLMPRTQGQTYEVGGPDRIKFRDLLDRIASHYKVKMNTMAVSSTFLKPLVKMMQGRKSFPLTVDQMVMLIEDNLCDPSEFQSMFGIDKLDSFDEALPALLDGLQSRVA
jgi:NADH dehydrogenase